MFFLKRIKGLAASNKDVIAVFIGMLIVFLYIMFFANSDLPAHARIARDMLRNNDLVRSNFLMYFMANLLTAFTGYLTPIKLAVVFLLAMANSAKYAIAREVFAQSYSQGMARTLSLSLLVVFIFPVLYLFNLAGCFPVDGGFWDYEVYWKTTDWYYVPNVWHNSTVIFMMPFALVTYFLSVKQFEVFDRKRNGWITLFVVLGTLAKPSFFFIYVFAFVVIMFARYRLGKEFFWSLIPVLAGCLCAVYVFASTFNGSDDNEVAISIMPVLEHWKPYLLFFVVSMLFPVLFVCCYRKEIKSDREFWFVLMMLVVGIGVYWCCHETGSRAMHGNFWWQTVAAMWFVYYYMLKTILKNDLSFDAESKKIAWSAMSSRGKTFLIAYGLHVLFGVGYLAKIFVTQRYQTGLL